MAAATVSKSFEWRAEPYFVHEVEVSSITSDQTENIANGSPTDKSGVGIVPEKVECEVITPPTVLCTMSFYRVKASDSTTNNTSAVKFVAEAGGDLVGMVAKVKFFFKESKAGGISSTS